MASALRRLQAVDLTSARLDRATLSEADLRKARLGMRVVRSGGVSDALVIPSANPCFPIPSCDPAAASSAHISDDTGVGALLVDTDLTGADLSYADLRGVVMVRCSLKRARLQGAMTAGSRWADVEVSQTLCPDGRPQSGRCTGVPMPAAGPERDQALARATCLQSLPWPWD